MIYHVFFFLPRLDFERSVQNMLDDSVQRRFRH